MKVTKLSPKDTALLGVLVVLLIGVCYYLLFYTPLQRELQDISQRSADLDGEITVASAKYGSMAAMQTELDNIFAQGSTSVTEIAPYDNAKVVMNELNGILSQSLNYKLTFADPVIGEDGTVRRTVSMSFTCGGYNAAKRIITNLCSSHWRCLMKNFSISGAESIKTGDVTCTATIVFFESTKLGQDTE